MQASKELKQRVVSSLIFSTVVAYPIYAGGIWTCLLSAVAGGLCVFEVLRCAKHFRQFLFVRTCAIIYILFGSTAFALLRDQFGLWATSFLIVATYLTDTFSFISGRVIGGPKLCPGISPKKTVSGFLCGVICSTAASYSFAFLFMDKQLRCMILSMILALVSTVGDLYISFIKRRFGIKDFGDLIPGHGGMLDRLDSVMLTSVVFYIFLQIK
ncbi:MAG: phosphatidate cytidylyltransferase [Holosporales bacterium]|jgi:phosphatidate cytidylyltransferase|nr:phosphatidate cytidylyltransferase [Holosporales bacterium]